MAHCVQAAFDENELHTLTTLADIVRGDEPAAGVTQKAGQMAFELAARTDVQQMGASVRSAGGRAVQGE